MIHESLGFAYWRKQKQFLKSSPFLSNILIWEHPPVSSAVNDSCLTPRPADLGSQQGCGTTSTKWKPHKVDQWRIPTALGNIFVPGWEANSVTLSHRFHLQQKKKKTEQSKSGHPHASAAAMRGTGIRGSTDHTQLLQFPSASSTLCWEAG